MMVLAKNIERKLPEKHKLSLNEIAEKIVLKKDNGFDGKVFMEFREKIYHLSGLLSIRPGEKIEGTGERI